MIELSVHMFMLIAVPVNVVVVAAVEPAVVIGAA